MDDKYPLLDKDDVSDKEHLEKYTDLGRSCLLDTERKEIMNSLNKYKATFGLRNKIGTCPNIEVEIDITDKSLFYQTISCKGKR